MIRAVTAGATLLLIAMTASAALYKWVDDKGVTHYSETPPADREAIRVETRPGVPAAAPDDWKKRDQEARRQRLGKDMAEDDRVRAHNAAAERVMRCSRARRQLEVLALQIPVYTKNERGEKVYLEDRDRDREVDGWRKEAEGNCDSP